MQPDLVSVVIPSYNRAYCIRRAIDSALAQTHEALEVIVVDDGSTDGTVDFLASAYASEPRLRCLRQENRGAAAARNTGLAAARGEFVAFLDSDDVWKPWKVALQVCCLRQLPEAGMIWTDLEAVDPEGRVVEPRYLRILFTNYRHYPLADLFSFSVPVAEVCPGTDAAARTATLYSGDVFTPMMRGNLVHTSTSLIRRSRLETVVRFNEELKLSGEDYDFHLRTCLAGPVAFVDVPSIQYQVGGADQLTAPAYMLPMSRNFLRTISPLIEQERARIALPDHVLAALLARAHAWIGTEALRTGGLVEAREHLRKSLGFRKVQPAVWTRLALAYAPRPAYLGVRWASRLAQRVRTARDHRP